MSIDRTRPPPTPSETVPLMAQLTGVMRFDVVVVPLYRGVPGAKQAGVQRRSGIMRRHIRVLAPFAGYGISRLPGNFLCSGQRTTTPETVDPDVLPDCGDCLRVLRRLFEKRLTRRQRRAIY